MLVFCIKGMHRDAEVINMMAFGEPLGALEYEEQEDGTVQLATQEILEVPCSDQSLVFLTWTWACCMTAAPDCISELMTDQLVDPE